MKIIIVTTLSLIFAGFFWSIGGLITVYNDIKSGNVNLMSTGLGLFQALTYNTVYTITYYFLNSIIPTEREFK